ncbi:MAG: hypothetical protein PHW34_04760 [Hespellia sp.]|nr:hypothetical protein [Hespellia sp.]
MAITGEHLIEYGQHMEQENTRREKERADKEKEWAEVTERENAALRQRIRELEGKK